MKIIFFKTLPQTKITIAIFLASIGSIEPISLAMMTMSIMETHTVMATMGGLWSRYTILK